MVLFFSSTLGASIIGLVALLMLKRYELVSGRTLFTSMRPSMNGFFHDILFFVEYVMPGIARRFVWKCVEFVRTQVKLILARGIFAFEHSLEYILHVVREKTEVPRGTGQVSVFLREVAEHKQSLLNREKKDRVILEEESVEEVQ